VEVHLDAAVDETEEASSVREKQSTFQGETNYAVVADNEPVVVVEVVEPCGVVAEEENHRGEEDETKEDGDRESTAMESAMLDEFLFQATIVIQIHLLKALGAVACLETLEANEKSLELSFHSQKPEGVEVPFDGEIAENPAIRKNPSNLEC